MYRTTSNITKLLSLSLTAAIAEKPELIQRRRLGPNSAAAPPKSGGFGSGHFRRRRRLKSGGSGVYFRPLASSPLPFPLNWEPGGLPPANKFEIYIAVGVLAHI